MWTCKLPNYNNLLCSLAMTLAKGMWRCPGVCSFAVLRQLKEWSYAAATLRWQGHATH